MIISSGCSDDCGPHGAPQFGLFANGDMVTLDFGDLKASANNDCTPMGSNVISVTIAGIEKSSPAGMSTISFCVRQPDQLGSHNLAIGSDIVQISLAAQDATCNYTLDTTRPQTGTMQGQHVCGNGTDKAGFELIVSGALSISRNCGGVVNTVAVTLSGTVAVSGM